MLGTPFPAADVLKDLNVASTSFPLQPLPPGLSYDGVDVLPDGIRVTVRGKDVTVSKGSLLGAQAC